MRRFCTIRSGSAQKNYRWRVEHLDLPAPPLVSFRSEAAGAAKAVRSWTDTADRPVNVWTICARLGIEIVSRRFSGPVPVEAVLVPTAHGGFRVGVDDRPPATTHDVLCGEARPTRVAFRVAHEIGHTMFFDQQGQEQRRSVAWHPVEETFCDEFASHLLMPDQVLNRIPRTAASLAGASAAFSVPLRSVVERVADADGGFAAAMYRRGDLTGPPIWSVGDPPLIDGPTSSASVRRGLLVLGGVTVRTSSTYEQVPIWESLVS